MSGENKMGAMPVPALLVNMSVPLMLSLLVQSLYNIVDGVFVARISENALTATSLAYPIQVLMLTVAVGTAIGVNSELARQIGRRDERRVSNAAVTGLLLTLLSSLVFVLAGILLAPAIARAMTKDSEIAGLCQSYLRICMVLCTGTFLEMIFQRCLQASGKTVLSMVSLFVGAGANLILDPVMIFGLLGCPAMGIRGAALATVIGQWLGAATAFLLNTFRNPEVKLRFRGYQFSRGAVAVIYRIGAPTMITNGVPSVMVAVMNAILMPYSASAVAFFGVYYKLQNFLLMPVNGLGQACLPILSYNYGTGRPDRIRSVFRCSVPAAAVLALVFTLVFLAVPGRLLGLFSPGAEMLALGVPALRIICLTFPLACVTVVLGYCASGLGNAVMMMTATLIRQFVVLIPLAWLLAGVWGVGCTWYAFWPAEAIALGYMILASLRQYRKTAGSLFGKTAGDPAGERKR